MCFKKKTIAVPTDDELYKLANPEKPKLPLITDNYIKKLEEQEARKRKNEEVLEKEKG